MTHFGKFRIWAKTEYRSSINGIRLSAFEQVRRNNIQPHLDFRRVSDCFKVIYRGFNHASVQIFQSTDDEVPVPTYCAA